LEPFPAKMVNYEIYGNIPIKDNENIKNYKVGIPMACFCDIPILRAQTHAKKYGNYVIGLDKEYMRYMYSPILNPVIYCDSENITDMIPYLFLMKNKAPFDLISKLNTEENKKEIEQNGFEKFIKSRKQNFDNSIYFKFIVNFLSGLFKYYSNPENKNEIYYDEREWRAFWLDKTSEETDWIWNADNLSKEDLKICNKVIEKSDLGYITIESQDIPSAITHIIVKKEKEKEQIIKHMMSSKQIFGCNSSELSEIDKLKLIGKITSFERIGRDY